MKLYSDLNVVSNDLLAIKTLQLTPISGTDYDSSLDTTEITPLGTIYLDSNIVSDTTSDNASNIPANLAKIGLKLKYRQYSDSNVNTTNDGEFNWLHILGGYLAKESTGDLLRYNLAGGRLLNANTTPRFASELVCKSYVDGLIGGKFTFAIAGDGTKTEFETPTAPAAGAIMGHISTVTLYERSGVPLNGTYSFTVVLADITIETSTNGTVVANIVKVKFTVAPAINTHYELRGA
jgi:hypothetical protein